MRRLIFLSLLIASLPLLGQQRVAPPIPEPGNVTLTLDDYNHLLELAAKPQKKPELIPVEYVIKRSDMKFKVDGDRVSGSITIQGEVLKKGVVKVPLSTSIIVLDASEEGKSVPLELDNGSQTAVLNGPSEFSIVLEAVMPLRIDAGRASISIPVPQASASTLRLSIPGDHTAVSINPGIITSRNSQGSQTTIEATLAPGQQANLWWATGEAVAPAAPREVHFLAELKTLVSVGEAELSLAALTDIDVVQGEPSKFELELPAGYEVTGVTGATLESSGVQGTRLVLKVSDPTQRSHQFLISMQKSLSSKTKTDVPILGFQNVQRESGEILVEGAGTLELTATEGGGLKRMDVKEANPYLRQLAHFPPQAAFRYHRQPGETPTLALEWVRFPDSGVLSAIAENAVVTTITTSEGKSLTEVKLSVKNQAQPFLKVVLPSGASILSAYVAGEPVKPVEGPDGNRVPLLRPGFRPTGLYEISFVFMHSGTPFAKKGGSELSLPPMDIPINLLQWEVFLPDRYKVKDFGGDLIAAELMLAAPATLYSAGFAGGFPAPPPPPAQNLDLNLTLPGQFGGIVTDQTGAIVANAHITVTFTATGITRTATSNQVGLWQIMGVPSGNLKVRVESPGFQVWEESVMYNADRPGGVSTKLNVGAAMETVMVESEATSVRELDREARQARKQEQAAQNAPSSNVFNLQQRVAGVLPVALDVPRAGTAFHFVRPLIVNEETKVTFVYRSK